MRLGIEASSVSSARARYRRSIGAAIAATSTRVTELWQTSEYVQAIDVPPPRRYRGQARSPPRTETGSSRNAPRRCAAVPPLTARPTRNSSRTGATAVVHSDPEVARRLSEAVDEPLDRPV